MIGADSEMKYESVLLLDARCLISLSIAHLQHELPRNPYNPPMDKTKVDWLYTNAKTMDDADSYWETSVIPVETLPIDSSNF